jgi:hypothetical protein
MSVELTPAFIESETQLLRDYIAAYVQSFLTREEESWARIFLKKMLQIREKSASSLVQVIIKYFLQMMALLKSQSKGDSNERFEFRKTYEATLHALDQWRMEV